MSFLMFTKILKFIKSQLPRSLQKALSKLAIIFRPTPQHFLLIIAKFCLRSHIHISGII